MAGSVGAESVAIIASVARCVVEGEMGDGKGRVQGGSMGWILRQTWSERFE